MKVRHQLMLEMFLVLQSLFGFIVETEETTLGRKSQEEKRYESPIVRCGKRWYDRGTKKGGESLTKKIKKKFYKTVDNSSHCGIIKVTTKTKHERGNVNES